MEVSEQLMMQAWLGNLLRYLEDGEVEKCKSELRTALTRIDEDQAEHGLRPAGDDPSAVSSHGDVEVPAGLSSTQGEPQ